MANLNFAIATLKDVLTLDYGFQKSGHVLTSKDVVNADIVKGIVAGINKLADTNYTVKVYATYMDIVSE